MTGRRTVPFPVVVVTLALAAPLIAAPAAHVVNGEVVLGEPPVAVTSTNGQMVENAMFLTSSSGRYLAAPRKIGDVDSPDDSPDAADHPPELEPEWSVVIIDLTTRKVVRQLDAPRELLHPGQWRLDRDEYDFGWGSTLDVAGEYGFDPATGELAQLKFDYDAGGWAPLPGGQTKSTAP